jgi:hypothetical protein
VYITDHTAFGDPQPAPLSKQAPPFLVFGRIGPFAVDKSVLPPQLAQQVRRIVDFVRSRLNTAHPIGVVRVVGHTDASGTELHNTGLGNRRGLAVRDELRVQLRDVLDRVLIEVEESPGKSKPIGDNRTAKGQAANRRVDVSVGPPIPPAPSWPKGRTYNWKVTDPDRGDIWDQHRFRRGMPSPLDGKTLRQFLMDLCERRFSRDTCTTLVDKAISAGCKGVEALLGRLGATMSSADKDEMQRQCKGAADRSL